MVLEADAADEMTAMDEMAVVAITIIIPVTGQAVKNLETWIGKLWANLDTRGNSSVDNIFSSSEWVHDRFSPSTSSSTSTSVAINELFARIGSVSKLNLRYDRAGRSEGTAYVTYERKEDAEEAIRQFDGANANGQPIRLKLLPSRNPFDTAVMPGRPLSERISNPSGRERSTSPRRRLDDEDAARRGIDRYIPGKRSRSPMPRRRGGREEGRRPGARREANAQESNRGGPRSNPRTKKTQEELDAEMADYFGSGSNDTAAAVQAPPNDVAPAAAVDDIDMIE
ncbi:hypothetical protein E4U41_006331 [Claviceps citrina]|nr:hypothetical protein E4U41_006331 [Claviceps citrina]